MLHSRKFNSATYIKEKRGQTDSPSGNTGIQRWMRGKWKER